MKDQTVKRRFPRRVDHKLFLSILLAGGSENFYYIWTKLYKSGKKIHTYIIEIGLKTYILNFNLSLNYKLKSECITDLALSVKHTPVLE